MKVSDLASELKILSTELVSVLKIIGINVTLFGEVDEKFLPVIKKAVKAPKTAASLKSEVLALMSASSGDSGTASKTPRVRRKGAEEGKESDPVVVADEKVEVKPAKKAAEPEKPAAKKKATATVKKSAKESKADSSSSHSEDQAEEKAEKKRPRRLVKASSGDEDKTTRGLQQEAKKSEEVITEELVKPSPEIEEITSAPVSAESEKPAVIEEVSPVLARTFTVEAAKKESEKSSADSKDIKKGRKDPKKRDEDELEIPVSKVIKPVKKERKRLKWDVISDDEDAVIEEGAEGDVTKEKVQPSYIIKRVLKKSKKKESVRTEKEKHSFNPRRKNIAITNNITVSEFASLIGIRVPDIIKVLMQLGIMATINQRIDSETAQLVATEFNIDITVRDTSSETLLEVDDDEQADLKPRPPVVTVMGHVDHGKTSLLDAIRKTNVIAGEAGGITQHIGAYFVQTKNGGICFLDTPGHAAFTAMRARGANVTDVVILVVAANDGPMPQTIEAINHAQAAGVPIIVAVNKCDLPDANPEKTMQKLMEHGIVAEEFGGDTTMVRIAAKQNQGITELLDILLLQAETMELKANPNRKASGVVIESKVDKGRGIVVTVLVKKGTLKKGDFWVVGSEYGRIRIMLNDQGKEIKEAGPAMPVAIVGLNGMPQAGDTFQVSSDEKSARLISSERKLKQKEEEEARRAPKLNMESFFDSVKEGEKALLKLVVKADVIGSQEAVSDALKSLGNDKVGVSILHSSVGAVSNSDVTLAAASSAVIIAFNVRPDSSAKKMALEDGVQIKLYSIIYNIIDDVKKSLQGMLDPIIREELVGRAEVLEVFNMPKIGVVAGCKVIEGKAAVKTRVRLIRDNIIVKEAELSSLRRFKDSVNEVQEGFECGIGLENTKDIQKKDVFEFFIRTEEEAVL